MLAIPEDETQTTRKDEKSEFSHLIFYIQRDEAFIAECFRRLWHGGWRRILRTTPTPALGRPVLFGKNECIAMCSIYEMAFSSVSLANNKSFIIIFLPEKNASTSWRASYFGRFSPSRALPWSAPPTRLDEIWIVINGINARWKIKTSLGRNFHEALAEVDAFCLFI